MSEMYQLIRLKPDSLEMTCGACPSQWEGTTEDDEYFYVRYRWGGLRIDINGETIHRDTLGDGLDGVCSWEDVVKSAFKAGIIIQTEETLPCV